MFLVLTATASACSNSSDVIAGEATGSIADAVGDASAPFEVDQLDATERPFLNYVEPNESDPRHPGHARFVLVDDDGEPRDVGTAPYDHFSFNVSLYEGKHEPIVMTMSFNNFTVNEDGRLDYGLCRGSWRRTGQLSQRSATEYVFLSGTFPAVTGFDFGWAGVGCSPDDPWIEPAGLFDTTFEFEFGEAELVLISDDGTRWRFKQVPFQLAAWEQRDNAPQYVPETATTTGPPPTADN